MGFFDSLLGGRKKEMAAESAKLKEVSDLLAGEKFTPVEGGLVSTDGIVGVYRVGWISYRFSDYAEFETGKLVEKSFEANSLLGDGKNWYNKERLKNILEKLKERQPRLMLRSAGHSLAVIRIQGAEIIIAPVIIPDSFGVTA